MLVGLVVPPAAAREYSIWEWWTNQAYNTGGDTLIPPPWGNAFDTATPGDVWDAQIIADNQTWTVPLGNTHAKGVLHVEYAGWATVNTFGFYDITDPLTLNPILPGAAVRGDTFDVAMGAYSGANVGFYLTNGIGTTWYSEADLNATDLNRKHLRVFNHPTDANAWILAWEDKSFKNQGYDYDGAWDKTNDPLAWYSPTEPDYNDMILSFKWETRGTPELSTILLLGLSVAAVPVLRRRRRA